MHQHSDLIKPLSLSAIIPLLAVLAILFEKELLALFLVVTFVQVYLFILFRSKQLISLENAALIIGWLYSTGLLMTHAHNSNISLFLLINASAMLLFLILRMLRLNELLITSHQRFLITDTYGNVAPFAGLLIAALGTSIWFYILFVKVGVVEYVFISRAARALIYRDLGVLALFREMVISGGLLLLYSSLMSKRQIYKWAAIFFLCVATMHAVLTISRAELMMVFIPILFLLCFFGVISEKRVVSVAMVVFPLLIAWKSILGILFFDFSEIKFSISEFESWYGTGQNIFDGIANGQISHFNGKSFVDGFLTLINPFYDATPLSVWYSDTFLNIYQTGAGRGFSMVVESYLNFGLIGCFIVFPALAVFIYLVVRFFYFSGYLPYIYCIFPAFLNKVFRSEFYSLIKTLWWIFLVPVVLIYLIEKVYKSFQTTDAV